MATAKAHVAHVFLMVLKLSLKMYSNMENINGMTVTCLLVLFC